jgi:MFS family permease
MGLALLGTSLGLRAVQENYSDSTIGLIMASYFAGFIIGSYVCPGLIRHIGSIRCYAALAAIASACAFMHTLLVSPIAWAALRCISGICMVGLYMVVESWLNGTTTSARRGQVFAVYVIVTLSAQAIGQLLLLLDSDAHTIAFGLAATFFSLGLVPVALTRLPQPVPVETPPLQTRGLLALAPLSAVGALIAGLVTGAFFGLGAVYASRIGLPPAQVAVFMLALISGGVLLQWPIGHLSDRYDRRRVLLAVAIAGMLASVLAALTARFAGFWGYLPLVAVGGMIFSIYALSLAYLNDRIHSHAALEASRVILLVFGIGAFAGPIIGGLSMELFGPVGLFFHAAFCLALLALYAARSVRDIPPVPEEERSVFIPMDQTSQAALDLDPRLDEALHHSAHSPSSRHH